MEALAIRLTNQSGLHGPIVDKTGLSGTFDFKLSYQVANEFGNDPDGTSGLSIFAALQQQLGLKLTRKKAPMEYLVLDHSEKPSLN